MPTPDYLKFVDAGYVLIQIKCYTLTITPQAKLT